MTFEEKHPIGQLFLDVLIASLLVVVGLTMAGAFQESISPNQRWLYPIWGVLGIAPVLCYMQLRGLSDFDRWDVLFYLPIPIVLALAIYFFGDEYPLILLISLIFLARWVKAKCLPTVRAAK